MVEDQLKNVTVYNAPGTGKKKTTITGNTAADIAKQKGEAYAKTVTESSTPKTSVIDTIFSFLNTPIADTISGKSNTTTAGTTTADKTTANLNNSLAKTNGLPLSNEAYVKSTLTDDDVKSIADAYFTANPVTTNTSSKTSSEPLAKTNGLPLSNEAYENNLENASDLLKDVLNDTPSLDITTDESLAKTAEKINEAADKANVVLPSTKTNNDNSEEPAAESEKSEEAGVKEADVKEAENAGTDGKGSTSSDSDNGIDNAGAENVSSNADADVTPANTSYSPFQASEATLAALADLQNQLETLKSGRTSYSDQLQEALSKYLNMDSFSYNADSDEMFQNYLASMASKGNTAMQDTLGQAASLTGGYGSSYATNAASQAYNSYLNSAYDNVADYYNMALENYNNEADRLYNNVTALSNADSDEWNRLYNAYSASLQNAENLYNNDYNQWESGYNAYRDSVSDSQWQAEMDRATENDEWSKYLDQQNLQLSKDSQAWSQYMDKENLALDKDSQAWNQYIDGENLAIDKANQALNEKEYENSLNTTTTTYKTPTPEILTGARAAYRSGGEDALMDYLGNYMDYDVDTIYAQAKGGLSGGLGSYADYGIRNYTVSDEGSSVFSKKKISDASGEEHTIAEWENLYINELVKGGMTKKQAEDSDELQSFVDYLKSL